MKINAFFANRLNAPFYNQRWSWGAVQSSTGRVFLRSGQDDIYEDNGDWLLVYHPEWKSSPGLSERRRHIELLRAKRCEGYSVLVEYNDKYKIKAFDDQFLLKLGHIQNEGDLIYAEVLEEISVDEVVLGFRSDDIVNEIAEVMESPRDETVRLSEVRTRLGQGEFRSRVLQTWDYRCCVTGVTTVQAIRASHIKPWSQSTNRERLDPKNGLPLVATLDTLFDAGLISFADDGTILISKLMKAEDVATLKLRGRQFARSIPKDTKRYLEYHRNHVFQC